MLYCKLCCRKKPALFCWHSSSANTGKAICTAVAAYVFEISGCYYNERLHSARDRRLLLHYYHQHRRHGGGNAKQHIGRCKCTGAHFRWCDNDEKIEILPSMTLFRVRAPAGRKTGRKRSSKRERERKLSPRNVFCSLAS